jgi:hypothetical protein
MLVKLLSLTTLGSNAGSFNFESSVITRSFKLQIADLIGENCGRPAGPVESGQLSRFVRRPRIAMA